MKKRIRMNYQVDYMSALFCVYKGLERTLRSPLLTREEKKVIQKIIRCGYKDISNLYPDTITLIYNIYNRLINETKRYEQTKSAPNEHHKDQFLSIFSYVDLGVSSIIRTNCDSITFSSDEDGQCSFCERELNIKKIRHLVKHLNSLSIKNTYSYEDNDPVLEVALQLLFFLGKSLPSTIDGVDEFVFYKLLAAKAACLNKETIATNKIVKLSLIGCKIPQVKNLLFSTKSSLSLIAGKSLYLQNLMRILSSEILTQLELPPCNLMQIDGNQFYILAREEDSKKVGHIAKKLIKNNKFGIPILIDVICLEEAKLNNKKVLVEWKRLGKRLYKKAEIFSETADDWNSNINAIRCLEDFSRFSLNGMISISKNTIETSMDPWQLLFDEYGWSIGFSAATDSIYCETTKQITVNQPKFNLNYGEFLGLIYLDIDNLGNVIKYGLKKSTNIFKQVALTSSLSYFCQDVTADLHKMENPYVRRILFGGDEFAFIGRINNIKNLIRTIKNSFDCYVRYNPYLTITGAITISKHSYAFDALVELREHVSYMKHSGQRGIITKIDGTMKK